MLIASAVAILVVMVMAIVRALLGPTIYDRILAVIGFLFGRPDFLDIALVYALINFISIVGVLRYFEYSHSEEEGGSL